MINIRLISSGEKNNAILWLVHDDVVLVIVVIRLHVFVRVRGGRLEEKDGFAVRVIDVVPNVTWRDPARYGRDHRGAFISRIFLSKSWQRTSRNACSRSPLQLFTWKIALFLHGRGFGNSRRFSQIIETYLGGTLVVQKKKSIKETPTCLRQRKFWIKNLKKKRTQNWNPKYMFNFQIYVLTFDLSSGEGQPVTQFLVVDVCPLPRKV